MLFAHEIADIRKRSEPLSDRDLEQAILLYQGFIDSYTKQVAMYRDSIKLLETILDERVA